jgi:hypothetical protein
MRVSQYARFLVENDRPRVGTDIVQDCTVGPRERMCKRITDNKS